DVGLLLLHFQEVRELGLGTVGAHPHIEAIGQASQTVAQEEVLRRVEIQAVHLVEAVGGEGGVLVEEAIGFREGGYRLHHLRRDGVFELVALEDGQSRRFALQGFSSGLPAARWLRKGSRDSTPEASSTLIQLSRVP